MDSWARKQLISYRQDVLTQGSLPTVNYRLTYEVRDWLLVMLKRLSNTNLIKQMTQWVFLETGIITQTVARGECMGWQWQVVQGLCTFRPINFAKIEKQKITFPVKLSMTIGRKVHGLYNNGWYKTPYGVGPNLGSVTSLHCVILMAPAVLESQYSCTNSTIHFIMHHIIAASSGRLNFGHMYMLRLYITSIL